MIKLLDTRKCPWPNIFGGESMNSEIFLSHLNHLGNRKIRETMKDEAFDWAIIIDPDINPALSALAEELLADGKKIVIISNRVPMSHKNSEEESIIRIANYLANQLPITEAIFHPPGSRLVKLMTEARSRHNFLPTRNMLISGFSGISVMAALKFLNVSDTSDHFEGGHNTNPRVGYVSMSSTPPLQLLHQYILQGKRKDNVFYTINGMDEFYPILSGLLCR